MITKPMLSGKAPDDLSTLKFPVAVSAKLDGFRALVINGVVCSRNLKPIRNLHVQKLFGKPEYEGYDGELIVGDPRSKTCFRDTSSGVTSAAGEPDVKFYVFDRYNRDENWVGRFGSIIGSENVVRVEHSVVFNEMDLLAYEESFLKEGYEGLMIRDSKGPYKQGRSTTREGWLLKLKRFEDSEALIVGMEEKMHNANEATKNALGHTERSSHQENLVPTGTMGALIVRDVNTGVEFNIGTGFDDAERDWWWTEYYTKHLWASGKLNNGGWIHECLDSDTIVKYRFFPQGSKDKPRFPTYLGIRHIDDILYACHRISYSKPAHRTA